MTLHPTNNAFFAAINDYFYPTVMTLDSWDDFVLIHDLKS